MNIFILDKDKRKNVQYHPNKHIVKMPIEGAQILCSAYYYTGEQDNVPNIYKLTHKNHPCAIWCRESKENWEWLKDFVMLLGEEYTYRYGKNHLSVEKTKGFFTPNLPSKGLTSFPLCMPEQYRCNDIVQSYRNYFIGEKQHLKEYKKRDIPEWWV